MRLRTQKFRQKTFPDVATVGVWPACILVVCWKVTRAKCAVLSGFLPKTKKQTKDQVLLPLTLQSQRNKQTLRKPSSSGNFHVVVYFQITAEAGVVPAARVEVAAAAQTIITSDTPARSVRMFVPETSVEETREKTPGTTTATTHRRRSDVGGGGWVVIVVCCWFCVNRPLTKCFSPWILFRARKNFRLLLRTTPRRRWRKHIGPTGSKRACSNPVNGNWRSRSTISIMGMNCFGRDSFLVECTELEFSYSNYENNLTANYHLPLPCNAHRSTSI